MTNRYFVFGAGFSGRRIARDAARRGVVLGGTTRSADKAGDLEAEGIPALIFSGALDETVRAALASTTHLVSSISPGEDGEPVLDALGGDLRRAMPNLRWAAYLSTIGVYGNHDGAWIGEDAELRPSTRRTRARVEAERRWLDAGGAAGMPVAVLRLSGIYGPGRNALVNLDRGTARRIIKPGQVFNRIHVADISGALAHLEASGTGGIFNVTDDDPAPPQDVITFAAGLMGIEPPPETPFDEASMTPMARSFYGETKRVSNARIKAAGYDFRYPEYRGALSEMWSDGSWRG